MNSLIINDSVYGKQEISHPSIISIIQTPQFQRLKQINQYGTGNFMTPKMPTTRYEHSIGVYLLLRKLRASFEEQIAGLVHDISHTAFSHVIDFFFKENITQEFHHEHFHSMLTNSPIKDILAKEGFAVSRIIEHDRFKLLEAEPPALNADRIDYGIRDSLLFNILSKDDADKIISSFVVKDKMIVMADKESASLLAWGYLNTSKNYWTHPLFGGSFEVLCAAIRLAKEKGGINEGDFFLTDNEVIAKMRDMNDERVNYYLDRIDWMNLEECGSEDAEFRVVLKPRYVDPLFLDNGRTIRYSEADEEFNKEVNDFIKYIKREFPVRIKNQQP